MPIWIPGTKAGLVPLTMQNRKGLFEDDDPYSRGGVASSYSSYTPATAAAPEMSVGADFGRVRQVAWSAPAEVRWHNVIVVGEGAAEELLLDRRGVIGRWQLFGAQDRATGTLDVRGILFIAVVNDTNGDKALDNLDARVAIVTDGSGRRPRTITPADAQVWSAAYSLERNALYLMVVRDSNGDGRFDFDDDSVPYEWTVGSDEPAVPLVSPEAVRRAVAYLR